MASTFYLCLDISLIE